MCMLLEVHIEECKFGWYIVVDYGSIARHSFEIIYDNSAWHRASFQWASLDAGVRSSADEQHCTDGCSFRGLGNWKEWLRTVGRWYCSAQRNSNKGQLGVRVRQHFPGQRPLCFRSLEMLLKLQLESGEVLGMSHGLRGSPFDSVLSRSYPFAPSWRHSHILTHEAQPLLADRWRQCLQYEVLFTKTLVESQSWLLKAAEVVFASGRNDFGQLGDSTRHSSYIHRCGWETYGQYTPPSETIAARVTRTYPVHLGIEILRSNGSHFVRCLQLFIASR